MALRPEEHPMTITYAADYYPYGKILREWAPCEPERFLTTQHERDSESGYDNRGARLYDADVGRFLSVDPLAQDYPSISGYAYVAGNPVLYNDPDGRDIMIHYQTERRDDNGDVVEDSDGNVIYDDHYVRYTPGMNKIGNEFADNVIMALNHIIANGADPHQIIKSLALRRRDRLIIQEDNARLNPFSEETFFTAEFPDGSGVGNTNSMQINSGAPTITWDPYRALAFYSTKIPTGGINALFGRRGYRSPAENLFHEIVHAYNFFEDPLITSLSSKLSKFVSLACIL